MVENSTPKRKSKKDALTERPDARALVAPGEVRIFEKIFNFLRDEIGSGTLRSGDRLLPERELARQLGASRTSLREALRAMEMLGLIETRPGQGVFVRQPSLEILRDLFGVALSMDPLDVASVIEARMAIECQAVRLACRHARQHDHIAMRKALDRLTATAKDGGFGGDADFDFHTTIVRASKNATLLILYESLQAMLRKSHRERRDAISRFPELVSQLGAAHEAIFRTILEGDEDAADAEMRKHFCLADDYFRTHPNDLGSGASDH